MKKILLILLTLNVLLSCDRNLLDATKTPDKINLDDIEGFEYKYVDVKPEVAPDGVVFGGLFNKFQFKGQWYVLADDIYKYNENAKTLTKIGSNAILRIDNEKTITIYAKNLPFNPYHNSITERRDYHDVYMNNAWYNLAMYGGSIVGEDELYNERHWLNYYEYSVNYSEKTIDPSKKMKDNGIEDVEAKWPSSLTLYQSGRGRTYTKDLVNWTTEYTYGLKSRAFNLPTPSFDVDDGPKPYNLNGAIGVSGERIVYFKGYFYVLGGYVGFNLNDVENKDATFDGTAEYYYRIPLGKNMSDPNNWERYRSPFGKRMWSYTSVDTVSGREKMYINDGYRYVVEVEKGIVKPEVSGKYINDSKGSTWSTTDGLIWNRDTEDNWNKSQYIEYPSSSSNIGPEPKPIYAKLNRKYVYAPNEAEIGGKTYSIYRKLSVMLPQYKIGMLVENNWITNYDITEEDITSSSRVKLMYTSTVSSEQKELAIPAPTFLTLSWIKGSDFLFNINGKLVRLVDYNKKDKFTGEYFANNLLRRKYSEPIWFEYYKNGGYTNADGYFYSANACLEQYVFAKAYAQLESYYIENITKHYMPDKAITHYSIDLSNAE